MLLNELLLEPVAGWSNVIASAAKLEGLCLLYVRFRENEPQSNEFAEMLGNELVNYVVPLKRRRDALQRGVASPTGGSTSGLLALQREAIRLLIQYNQQHPERYGEVGELISYGIATSELRAPQIASKMTLKTSSEMAYHGADGLHLRKNDDGSITFFLVESKLEQGSSPAIADFCRSVSKLKNNRNARLNELRIVENLSNLDALEGEARKEALSYFNPYGESSNSLRRRERFVGSLVYAEPAYDQTRPLDDNLPVDYHEKSFVEHYEKKANLHAKTLRGNAEKESLLPGETEVFVVAVPSVKLLKQRFAEVNSGHIRN